MATMRLTAIGWISGVGVLAYTAINLLGDVSLFAANTLAWMVRRRPAASAFWSSCYNVGVRSLPVVAITGMFIGMVLAVQSYHEFYNLGLATRLGSIINISVVRELGPVLAATMIAGRVGSAMAAELGTMRVTDQIDALTCLGVNPVHYLVVPRFLACVLLIPLLTVLADAMGIIGGAVICVDVYHVEGHHYWTHSQEFVRAWDIMSGLIKSVFFGAVIALVSCHRGYNCRAGAEGVGRAATEAFVASFIVILILDFFLAMFLNDLSARFFPSTGKLL
ncbi:MAG TPA: ABC transporter permease [Gemmataceae bacterium]|jgi:phospholipid/cholesterol/gamma-HCH transport system permease protein|nr:ABC transporter permease [Gemmataceae bacterium]